MDPIDITNEIMHLIVSAIIAAAVIRHFKARDYSANKYATFWPRFWSPTIDNIVLWPLVILIPYILQSVFFKENVIPWIALFTTAIQFTYSIYFNGRYGGTIGKLKCNIRIVDHKTEGPISYKQALLRDAIPLILITLLCGATLAVPPGENDMQRPQYIASIFILWIFIEILTMLINSKRRALHDFIAGTVVVQTRLTNNPWDARIRH